MPEGPPVPIPTCPGPLPHRKPLEMFRETGCGPAAPIRVLDLRCPWVLPHCPPTEGLLGPTAVGAGGEWEGFRKVRGFCF